MFCEVHMIQNVGTNISIHAVLCLAAKMVTGISRNDVIHWLCYWNVTCMLYFLMVCCKVLLTSKFGQAPDEMSFCALILEFLGNLQEALRILSPRLHAFCGSQLCFLTDFMHSSLGETFYRGPGRCEGREISGFGKSAAFGRERIRFRNWTAASSIYLFVLITIVHE